MLPKRFHLSGNTIGFRPHTDSKFRMMVRSKNEWNNAVYLFNLKEVCLDNLAPMLFTLGLITSALKSPVHAFQWIQDAISRVKCSPTCLFAYFDKHLVLWHIHGSVNSLSLPQTQIFVVFPPKVEKPHSGARTEFHKTLKNVCLTLEAR